MPAITVGTGLLEAGKFGAVMRPRLAPAAARPLVVYFHPSASTAADMVGAHGDGQPRLLNKLVDWGWVIAGTECGTPNNWGYPAAMTATDAVYAARASLGAASGAGVHLVGVSMGAVTALRWAVLNPTKVKSITTIIGVHDVDDARTVPALAAQQDAVWGVAYPAPLPAGANPFAAAELVGLPFRAYTSSDDPTTPNMAARAQTLAARIGGSTVNLGAVGHSDAAVASVDPFDLAAHLWAHP